MVDTVQLLITWGAPLGLVLAGLIAGLILNFFLRRYLIRLAELTHWQYVDLIVRGLAGKLPLWGLLVGVMLALPMVSLNEAVHTVITKAVYIVLVLSITWTVARLSGELFKQTMGLPERAASTTIFNVIVRVGIWAVGIMVVLPTLGISITPILTALGVGGLAVALALQDTLSNLFSGIQILLSGQIKVGDYIRLDSSEEGYVTDINWRNTTIRQLPNNLIVVPNRKLAEVVATNYNLPEHEMSVLVQVGVSYKSDLAQVERVTIEVATEVMKNVEGGVPEHQPFIRYHTFGDSSINFSVILRAREFVDQYLIKHEFIKRLHARYKKERIEIPLPQLVVTMNKMNNGR